MSIARSSTRGAKSQGFLQLGPLGRINLCGSGCGLLAGLINEVLGCLQTVPQAPQPGRELTNGVASRTSFLVPGQAPRPPNMPLTSAGSLSSHLRGNAVTSGEQICHSLIARRSQVKAPTSRPDRDDDVLWSRGTQQPDGFRRRLLDSFKQGVSSAFSDAIGIFDDDNLVTPVDRIHRRSTNQFTHFINADRQCLSTH